MYCVLFFFRTEYTDRLLDHLITRYKQDPGALERSLWDYVEAVPDFLGQQYKEEQGGGNSTENKTLCRRLIQFTVTVRFQLLVQAHFRAMFFCIKALSV